MTASRSSRHLRMTARTVLGAAAVGALMLGLAPVAAFALNDPTPIGLPPIQPGEQPTEEPASTPPPDPTAADPATGQVQGGIGGTPLPPLPPGGQAQPADPAQPIDPVMQQPAATGAPGLLDDSNAGLGANIWQGSSGAQLVSLMPKLAAPQTQPSLRDLQLRLLLTRAPGPNAGNGVDTLVPLRAERLHAMGFSAEAMLLTRGAANAAPADAKGAFEKALSGQDSDTACAKVDEVVASPQTLDLYWRKALLFCQIQRGQKDQASSGLAAAAVTARDAGLPLNVRIESGEQAFAGGLVSADELIGLYRQVKFTGDPLTMPDSPMMRAQLYQAADQAFDPVRRAQFVQRALANARARATYFVQGALYRPIADKVTPSPNLAWFAPEAARLMFWSGNVERGGFWLNLAQGAAASQPDVARALPGLQILAEMAGLNGNYDSDPVMAWQQAGGNPGLAERIRGIRAGLGLSGGIAPVASGEAAAISQAAQSGRRGETVLLALVALGGRGLSNAESATLAQALGGLESVGLQDEARRIGIEAAILAGL